MKKGIVIIIALMFVFVSSVVRAEGFDPDAISQVSKGIAEWKLMNQDKSETQAEPQVYVSSALSGMVERGSGKGAGVVMGLSAFDNDASDFVYYINKPSDNWYPVDSMGTPAGGIGSKPLPGEKIYIHIDDLVPLSPSWRNITPIPTYRSKIDPMYRGESAIGINLVHIEWGSGNPQKIYGTGGHGLQSYEQMAPPLQANRIRVHSQGGIATYNQYMGEGWKGIEPFQGKTILGSGHGPLDAGKNQVATGGYANSFPRDVITRAAPWNLGSPFGNPLKMEAEILRSGSRIGGAGMNMPTYGNIPKTTSVPSITNYPPPDKLFPIKNPLDAYKLPPMPKLPTYTTPSMPKIPAYTPSKMGEIHGGLIGRRVGGGY